MKKLFKNRRKRKLYAIKSGFGEYESWYEGGCFWNDLKSKAMLGTKKQMTRLLNNELYQSKLRGAMVVKIINKNH